MNTSSHERPVALITGAARRVGNTIARQLHQNGYNIVVHYHHSHTDAELLIQELNQLRPHSSICLSANLCDNDAVTQLAERAIAQWQRLDCLVNNASSFYPTPVGNCTDQHWDDLIGSNLKAPFFLSQACANTLKVHKGNIINIADIHAERPLKEHSIYCIAKAGNVMLTKTLAKELAPDIRVNGIAPGAIMWPENEMDDAAKASILERVALERPGDPHDIAQLAAMLQETDYITGQIIAVDGGRTLAS